MSEILVEQSHQAKMGGRRHTDIEDPSLVATGPGVIGSKLEAELRRAVERQEFRVCFQPICCLDTGLIVGFEALVRWQHPTRGLLSPAEFLQAAEQTGLIVPIGLWVLREACRQVHGWHLQFPDNQLLRLSVNISSKQFQQPDLVEQIRQILHETGLNADSLRLEITETLVMQNSESARTTLLQLRALNVKLAIDDFGTGYSSLSYLQRFPVHTLKIDQSFICKLQDAKESLEIVRAIVTLAHNLGLDVIAEGVETADHLAMLQILKCEFGQGYLYSRPVDAECAAAMIAGSRQGLVGQAIGLSDINSINTADNRIGMGEHRSRIQTLSSLQGVESSIPSGSCFETGATQLSNSSNPSLNLMVPPAESRNEEEFEIHIANVKQEAIKQFDQELYAQCLPTFRFLSELEPENCAFRDYRLLCEQLLSEQEPQVCVADLASDSAGSDQSQKLESACMPEGGAGSSIQQTVMSASERRDTHLALEPDAKVEKVREVEAPARHLIRDASQSWPRWSVAASAISLAIIGALWFYRVNLVTPESLAEFQPNRRANSIGLQSMTTSLSPDEKRQEAASRVNEALEGDSKNPLAQELKKTIRTKVSLSKSSQLTPPKVERSQSSLHVPPTSVFGTRSSKANSIQKALSEVATFSVIHEHRFGSCRGDLKITRDSIVYESSSGSHHSFDFKTKNITGTELGDTLRISFGQEAYRFKSGSAKNKQENRAELVALDQKVTRARAFEIH